MSKILKNIYVAVHAQRKKKQSGESQSILTASIANREFQRNK